LNHRWRAYSRRADHPYFLHDGLGSTTELADDAGTVTGTYAYDVFGPIRAHTGAS
jgi:hypothetical protein